MKLVDLLHRWTGGLIGLLLAVLGLSGAVLVHRDAWIFLPHAGDAPLRDTQIIANVTQRIMADPVSRPQSITYASDSFGLLRVSEAEGGGAYFDQAGNVIAHWDSQWERPELWLFDLHHHLLSGDAGETVAGLAAVAGLFFVITGLILWWRTRKTFTFQLLPKRMSRSAIVRHHRDLGVVMAPLLLLSLLTGAILIFRPMAGLILGPSAPAQIERALKGPEPRKTGLANRLDWAGMIEEGRARFPDADIRSLSLPRGGNGLITLRMKRPNEWLPNGRTTLWFAADTGKLLTARDANDLSNVVATYNMLYPLHAAKVGGLGYRIVMTVSGLALGLLGTLTLWTFWFRRTPRPRRRMLPPGHRQPIS